MTSLPHRHVCVCGTEFRCQNDPEACTVDLCDQCEADLYWDARAPEDVRDEQAEMNLTDDRCADPAQRELEF